MTLKDKLKWEGATESRLVSVKDMQLDIASGKAKEPTYYLLTGAAFRYAVECYVEGDIHKLDGAARLVESATLDYFYGDWRKTLPTPDGNFGHEEWKPFCLWYEQVMRSLPWVCALDDWKSARKIAEYPPENRFPEAAKAGGESAWGWALVTFIRGQPRKQVEHFLAKVEASKAKRPKLLCHVLRALLDNDAVQYEKTLLAYLAYYRKTEFKMNSDKVLALDGTILYHLGRKQGFNVTLPENVADHVIRFD